MNADLPQLDYLVIACHPDDAEIGCGGAILSLREHGAKVGVLDLTDGEPTPHGSPEIRRRETSAATALLQLDWRGNLGLPNRSLVADLEARRLLAGMIRQLRPRRFADPLLGGRAPRSRGGKRTGRGGAILGQADQDRHACRAALPSQDPLFSQHAFAPAFSSFLRARRLVASGAKMQALACYHSQFVAGRPATPPTIFDDINARAGIGAGRSAPLYGEPFLCREEVGIRNLQHLHF